MVGKSGAGTGAPQPEEKSARAKHVLGDGRNNNAILDGICKRGCRICIELTLILSLSWVGEARAAKEEPVWGARVIGGGATVPASLLGSPCL